ncbi:MAG TPA: hypothetical protein PLU22_07250 [Polyangiaceae bacterium]|nr:hypothetical protein [Polyangiaceae bacterium]
MQARRSPWSRARWRLVAGALPVLVLACSGGAPPPASPDDATGDEEHAGQVEAPAESSAKVTSYCTDEGCFDCGDGFCMQGWYCDLGVRGGPACSFVPECEAQSSCACVTAVLGGGCRCDERDGGAYVTCD